MNENLRASQGGSELTRAQARMTEQSNEIERLRAQLAQRTLAQDIGEAVVLTASAGTIATPVSHDQLLRLIVETAAHVISAQSASLFLIDEEAQELVFEVALGPKAEEVQHHRVPLGHGIAGLVALSGQPMAVSDASQDPRQASDIAKAVGYVPESLLCVPLFYGDRVIGVLELLDKIDEQSFSVADLEALGLFANQAAVSIAQSRAHGNLGALLNDLLETHSKGEDDQQHVNRRHIQEIIERTGGDDATAFREAIELAELVQEIAWHGDRERLACKTLLRGFTDYLRSRPEHMSDPGVFR